jgi:hypothetical protein
MWPDRRLLLGLGLLFAGPVLAETPAPTVPRLTGEITLDGRLAEMPWRGALRLPQSAFSRWVADRYTPDPEEFNLRLFHDGRRLYVALVSYDRQVQSDPNSENADGLYAISLVDGKGALQHYRLRWSTNPPVAGGQMLDSAKWGARLRGPYADPTHEGGGYVLEFAIPFTTTGWKPGSDVLVNVIVQDRDGKPDVPYNHPAAAFARFALGSLDNDDRTRYFRLRLAR